MRLALAVLISLLPVVALAQTTGTRPGQARAITGSATSNEATTADYNGLIVWRSTSTAPKTQTLPACNASASGVTIGVVDGQNTASSTATITLAAPSGSSVVGPATAINTARGSLEATCDGTSTWVVTANNNLPGTGGGGGVASITAGTGLSGGTIGAGQSGTISMPNVGTAGTCTNCTITRDAQGRVSSASNGSTGGGGGGEPAWTVVVPSGTGDDFNTVQDALNASRKGVILSANESISDSTRARSFNICRTLRIPRDKVLIGTRVGHYWGGTEDFGWEQWQGGPVLTCGQWFGWSGSGTNQFSTTNCPYNPACAQLAMSSNTTIEGFSVNGFRRPGPVPNDPDADWAAWGVCINAVNTKGPTIRFMNMLNCRYSAVFAGSGRYNGSTWTDPETGWQYFQSDPCCGYAPISQMQAVHNNTFWYVGNGPMFGPDWNGGPTWSAADIRVFANECEICTRTSMQFYFSGSSQVHDNRIEDAGGCMEVINAEHLNIHGNHFNDQACDLLLENSHHIQVVDNSGQGQWWVTTPRWEYEGCWHISGHVDGLIANSNQCRYGKYGAWYVHAGGSVGNMTLMDGPTGATGVAPAGCQGNACDPIWYPPLFRDRRTTVALASSEVLHFLAGSRWATAWANSAGGGGTSGNTIFCCGGVSPYTSNPNTN